MYTPRTRLRAGVMTDTTELCGMTEPTVAMMMEASIRAGLAAEPTPGWLLYEGHPPMPVRASAGGAKATAKATATGGAFSATEVLLDDPRVAVLQAACRRAHIRYKDIRVKRVSTTQTTRLAYLVHVIGEGASFCQNKGQDHSKSGIYFNVSLAGVVQRCWCKKSYNGKGCSVFKGNASPLTATELTALRLTTAPAAAVSMDAGGSGAMDTLASLWNATGVKAGEPVTAQQRSIVPRLRDETALSKLLASSRRQPK
jgi:hypothetical protein